MTKQKIKIVLAEDQHVIRKALRCFIELEKDMQIVSEVCNGKELLEFLKLNTPDVVLLDMKMPIMNGCEALEIICKRFPNAKVIMLSMYDDFNLIIDLMTKGARGFVSKNNSPEFLVQAIREVYKDGHFFDKKVSEAMLNGLLKEKSINPYFDEQALSGRETEIMKEICNGLTNNSISKKLNISASTVDFHKRNIYRKTKSKNTIDLMKYAIKHQMILIS